MISVESLPSGLAMSNPHTPFRQADLHTPIKAQSASTISLAQSRLCRNQENKYERRHSLSHEQLCSHNLVSNHRPPDKTPRKHRHHSGHECNIRSHSHHHLNMVPRLSRHRVKTTSASSPATKHGFPLNEMNTEGSSELFSIRMHVRRSSDIHPQRRKL